MSFTLEDFFSGFQSLKQSKQFSANAQSTYYVILAEFDSAHYPATLQISTRGLQKLAGLKSVSMAHECRNVLKNHKLIDFKTTRDITVYRLLTEHLPNTKTVSAEHQPNGNRTPDGLFAIPCAPEAAAATEAKGFPPHPPSKNKQTNMTGARGNEGGGDDTNAGALPLRSPAPDPNDIQAEWSRAIGYDLRGNRALELERLASLDYERAAEAIKRTAKQNAKTKGGLDDEFRYFKAVYDGLRPTKADKPPTADTQPAAIDEYKRTEPTKELMDWCANSRDDW